MTSTHHSTAQHSTALDVWSGRRRDEEGFGIALKTCRRQASGHCRSRVVREYRQVCDVRVAARQGFRMSRLVFAMTQNGRGDDGRMEQRPRTPIQAPRHRGGGRPVGAMATRLWEDHARANHYLDRFVLASTCIHLIRKGWKEPRKYRRRSLGLLLLEAGAMLNLKRHLRHECVK